MSRVYSHHGDSTIDRVCDAIERVNLPHDTWESKATRNIMTNLFNRNGFTRVFLMCIDRDKHEPEDMKSVNDIAQAIHAIILKTSASTAPVPVAPPKSAATIEGVLPGTLPVESSAERVPKRKRKHDGGSIVKMVETVN